MYWLLGRKSKLSINNKLLIYKVILKLIRTYGIQLWGTISNSNIEILERFHSKVLRLIVDAHWYVLNSVIRNDLPIPTVNEEIGRFSSHYNVRISVHPNGLIASLTEPPIERRLRR
jgi:UV DNA damage repair endonuclease